MYNGHIAGAKGIVDGFLLHGVKPGQTDGRYSRPGRLLRPVENVTQNGQPTVAGRNRLVERTEHETVGSFVKIKLDAHKTGRPQLVGLRCATRQTDHHAVGSRIAHRSHKIKISQCPLCVTAEKAYRTAILKIVRHVLLAGTAQHFNDKLVQGIVVSPSETDRKPTLAALYFAANTHNFSFALKRGFFISIFLLQQRTLLQKMLYGILHETSYRRSKW